MSRVGQLVFDELDDALRVALLLVQHVHLVAQPLPLPACPGPGVASCLSLQERQLRESLEEYSLQLTEAAAVLLFPDGPAS